MNSPAPGPDAGIFATTHWSVVLAAPPPDVDLPGGLFRSARRWLTLQSRAAFMIVRLNDGDWRQVIDTIAARIGVRVEESAGNQ